MHWAESDLLKYVKSAHLKLTDGKTVELEIGKLRPSGQGFLVKFVGVDDRNAAEALRGAFISVDRSLLPPADPGEAYLSDLIGRQVFGPDGNLVGKVVDVATYPSVDAIIIERDDGSKVEQPLVDDWVEPFDATSERIVLRSLDGLVG